MVAWLTLLVPFAYVGVLIGSLVTFSTLYRIRKNARAASLEPWFPPHLQKNVYLSLLHHEPPEGSNTKVPDSVLKAALLRRAIEDIHRIIAVRNAKGALQTLVQRGSVGDDLWQRFLRAEKEIEEELRDVVTEANAFAPQWGTTIFASANEMAANTVLRQRITEIQEQAPSEREWWNNKKASIQSDFMKELDEEAAASAAKETKPRSGSDDDAVIVEKEGPTGQQGGAKKKKGKK